MENQGIRIINPPWQLKGDGYIFVLKNQKDFVAHSGFVPQYLEGKFKGGLGYVMLVDYKESPVGQYQELLYIPGTFNYAGYQRHSITKIFVSSEESVVNGQNNWGIPKELAEFDFQKNDKELFCSVKLNGEIFFKIELKRRKFRIPDWTSLSPFKLLQELNHERFLVTPKGKGAVSPAKLVDARINNAVFPDFTHQTIIAALEVNDFKLIFPAPEWREKIM